MKNWRSVNTKSQLATMSRQLVRSVKGDTTLLNQSQRDMLAAIAMRDRGLTMAETLAEFDTARSSLGFARTVLRFADSTVSALVLSGAISVHVLDRLRRRMGSEALANHLMSLSDEQITERYVSRKGITKSRYRAHTRPNAVKTENYAVTVERTVNSGGTDTGLTRTQKRAQNAANARWAKANANKAVVALPTVDREALSDTVLTLSQALSVALRGDTAKARVLVESARRNLSNI